MTAEQNKALVRRLLARIEDKDKWDPAVLDEFFATSFRRYLTTTTPPLTAGEHRERVARLRAAFPDAYATLEDMVAEGNRVAYRLTIRGTHQGIFQGIPPTQKRVAVSFTAIVRIEDGKLVEEWGGLDVIDLLHQLGEMVSVGPEHTGG
jgi:predicted ester cyclase